MQVQTKSSGMQNKRDIDIILPCYNPHEGWEIHVLDYFQAFCAHFPHLSIGLIIVDDGSTQSIDIDKLRYLETSMPYFIYEHYPYNKGKGHALRTGARLSHAPLCIYTDIDFPFEIENIVEIARRLMEGAEVVWGIRKDDYDKQLRTRRKWLTKISRFVNRWVLALPLPDSQGGLKGMNQKGKQLFLQTRIKRYLFDTEFLLLIQRALPNLKLEVIGITLRQEVHLSEMGWKVLSKEWKSMGILLLRRVGL